MTAMTATDPPVTFDYAAFVAAFPLFAGLSEPQATAYFKRANLYCWNSVQDQALRTGVSTAAPQGILPDLLNLLVAHIAWLEAPRDANGNPSSAGKPPSPIVGRINTASQGSVSVGAELNGSGSPSEAWFTQTTWGFEFWQATAQFRTAVYVANPTRVPGTGWPYYAGVGRYGGRFGRFGRGW